MKIYELYPDGAKFTVQTSRYSGTIYKIAAENVRQAYYFAYNTVWATAPGQPGIVEIYHKYDNGLYQLWDGCKIHFGLGVSHGNGKRAITEAMNAHQSAH